MASRLYKIKETQVQMVGDRGFDVSAEANFLKRSTNLEEFYKPLAGSLRRGLSTIYVNPAGEKLLVYYGKSINGKKLGSEFVEEFLFFLQSSKVTNVILIVDQPLTPGVNGASAKLHDIPMYQITVFLDEQMLFNPTRHYLVPKHVALTPEETTKFFADTKLKPHQLPILRAKDPIARYYGFQQGQIIKIYRINLSNESLVTDSVSYRMVGAKKVPSFTPNTV